MIKKIKHCIKEILQFILNPRLLLCLGIGWIITNGWSYIFMVVGTACDIPWMVAVSGAYMAFLWFPFTPEKILTVIIAMFLLRWLFPNDQKTLKKLKDLRAKYHTERVNWKAQRKAKRAEKKLSGEEGYAPKERIINDESEHEVEEEAYYGRTS